MFLFQELSCRQVCPSVLLHRARLAVPLEAVDDALDGRCRTDLGSSSTCEWQLEILHFSDKFLVIFLLAVTYQ